MKQPGICHFGLTPRELQVARLIAKGKPRKFMADNLKISIHTIAVHVSNIKRKIGAETLFESGCILSHYF